LCAVVALALMLLALPLHAKEGGEAGIGEPLSVVAAIPHDFPPTYYLDTKGNPAGFAIDVMALVADRANLRVSYISDDDWNKIFARVAHGEADLVPNLGINNQRRALFIYSEPMETFVVNIFVRSRSSDIAGIADLTGKQVGVIQGSIADQELRRHNNISIVPYDSFPKGLFELLAGHVDAFVGPENNIMQLARQARVDREIKAVGPPLVEVRRAIAVRRDRTDLAKRIDAVLPEVLASPEFRKIYARWYGTPTPFWSAPRIIGAFGVLIALLLIVMAFWRYRTVLTHNAQLSRAINEWERAENEVRQLNSDLERRIAERTSELSATNRELESFVYSVSHDLRAPLRAIEGYSAIINEEYEKRLDREGTRLFAAIRWQTRQMGELIDDLLKFSRSGRQGIELIEVDLKLMVLQLFQEMVELKADRRVELKVGALPLVLGDRHLLRQVMQNLLSNAIKYSASRPLPLIEVEGCTEESGSVRISIRDNGVGFDMAQYGRLFGVFQRLHSATEYEGSGVGLAIVQRIIERHGGRVWGEGVVDGGATFTFTLPAAQPTG
jgi:signal transduction histidine kinase